MKNLFFSNETNSSPERNLIWIDVANKKDLISTFIFFFLILFSLLYFIFWDGSEQVYDIYQDYSLSSDSNDEYTENFFYDLSPISIKNRFVRFSILFNRNATDEFDETISFNYTILRLYENGNIHDSNKNVTVCFHLKDGQFWTDEYILYTDFILDYEKLSLNIFLNKSNTEFINFEINCLYASSESTICNAYYRSIFIVLHIIQLVLLIHKKRSNEVKYFNVEQIFLFPLIVSIILSNNPFYVCKLIYPTSFYYQWMLYTTPISDGIIYFSQIIFFVCYSFRLTEKKDRELLLPDNSKIQNSKFRKILIICLSISIIYIILIFSSNYYSSLYFYSNNFPSYDEFHKFKKINYFKSLVEMFFSILTLVVSLASLIIIDILAPPPFIYLLAGIGLFLQKFLFEGFFIFFDYYDDKNRPIIDLLKFVMQNVFCLFYTIFHFPYDIREQCSQIDSTINNNDEDKCDVDENKVLVIEDDNLIYDGD